MKKKVRIVKGVILVLFLLVAASAAASAAIGSPSVGDLGPGGPHFLASNANSKSMEDKFAEALHALKAANEAGPKNRADALKAGASPAGSEDLALNNSSSNSTMLNSSNSSHQADASNNSSVSALNVVPLSNGSDQQKVGASSRGSFQGFYGLTASKHEMGKSDIKSRMFLSGGFDVDKTVSFTDRDF